MEDGKYEVPPRLKPYLTPADLETIAIAVRDAEMQTAGEIRVHINAKLFPFQTPRGQAKRVFRKLRMDQTRDRTGVLLYLTIRERRFEIIVDRGIEALFEQSIWDKIARNMRTEILEKSLSAGICSGVQQIGELLATKFPRKEDDLDELSNQVSFDSKNPKS